MPQEVPVRVFLRLRPPTAQEEDRKECLQVLDTKRTIHEDGTVYGWEQVSGTWDNFVSGKANRESIISLPRSLMRVLPMNMYTKLHVVLFLSSS